MEYNDTFYTLAQLPGHIWCSYFETNAALFPLLFWWLNLAVLMQLLHLLWTRTFLVHTNHWVTFVFSFSIYLFHVLPPKWFSASPDLVSLLWERHGQSCSCPARARKATKYLLCCWSAAQFFSYVNAVICRWTWWILNEQRRGGKPPTFLLGQKRAPEPCHGPRKLRTLPDFWPRACMV